MRRLTSEQVSFLCELELPRIRCARVNHGLRGHPLYGVWADMKTRCSNLKDPAYKDYGSRGIKVCPKWLDSFTTFYSWAINNGWKEELQIDRIDNDGGYEPSNCRFVTRKEQRRNCRNNRLITIDGETKTVIEWCEIVGITHSGMWKRLHAGWTGKRLLAPPRVPYHFPNWGG